MFAGLRKKWRDQIGQTKTILGEKVREALASVVPITLIVLILCFTAAPVPTDVLLAFLVGRAADRGYGPVYSGRGYRHAPHW